MICNYCFVESIKREANKTGARVYVRNSGFMGGVDIFKVPRGETLAPEESMIGPCEEYPDGNEAYAKHHVAWFMELPSTCCC